MSFVDALTPAEVLAVRAILNAPAPEPQAAGAGGFIATVAPNQLITSDWGNAIRDDVIIRFATVADRDLYWPAATAPNGARCVTLNDNVTWQTVAGVWRQLLSIIDGTYASNPSTSRSGTGMFDVLQVNPPVMAVATTMRVSGVVGYGSSGALVNGTADILRYTDSATTPNVGLVQAGAGAWVFVPVQWSWLVAANADPSFKLRVNVTAATGGWFSQATVSMIRTLGSV